jgi:hypothetical protein
LNPGSVTLKLIYKLLAAAMAAYALTVLVWPGALRVLIDDVSAQVNGFNIMISFFVLVVWALVTIRNLLRTKPQLSDWPRPQPLWLGLVWLLLCVAYTGFEHGWVHYPAFVYAEDGLFESATALALLFCAGLFCVIGFGRARRVSRMLALAVLALGGFSALLLLEEISWGQRIFGWSTPERLEELNAQQETNLHNMFVGYNQLIRLVLSLLIASALIHRDVWMRGLNRLSLGALMPPAAAIYFVPFLIYAHTYDELYEEVVGVFLIAYSVNLYRRLAAAAGPRSGSPA